MTAPRRRRVARRRNDAPLRSRGLTVILALLALAAGGSIYAWQMRMVRFGTTPGAPDRGERIMVTITDGATVADVGRALEGAGVIDSGAAFARWIRRASERGDGIKAGTYALSPAMTPVEVLRELRTGTQYEVRFTVPEGLRKEEIAAIMATAGFGTVDDIVAIMADADFIADCGAPADVPGGVEGYLFPDTYQFPPTTPPRRILRRMCARLQEVVDNTLRERMLVMGWDLHQTLTLASIIEKETGSSSERPRISAVFHRRLKKHMKLQTDPTVVYGVDDFDGTIGRSDLRREHPYNTYIIPGLPPGPIAQPGLAAIKAALFPVKGDALFFVARGDGTHEFCPDLACHEAAIDRYVRGRSAP